jgi:hypothetical protein
LPRAEIFRQQSPGAAGANDVKDRIDQLTNRATPSPQALTVVLH